MWKMTNFTIKMVIDFLNLLLCIYDKYLEAMHHFKITTFC